MDSSVELSFWHCIEPFEDLQLLEQEDRMENLEEGGNSSKDREFRERILVEGCEWKQDFLERSIEMTRTVSSIFDVYVGFWMR
jgi:hypothetical protein